MSTREDSEYQRIIRCVRAGSIADTCRCRGLGLSELDHRISLLVDKGSLDGLGE